MSKPIDQMTVDDVCAWLASVELDKHAAIFRDKRIKGSTLAEIDRATLAEIGITKALDQTEIIGSVTALKRAGVLSGRLLI